MPPRQCVQSRIFSTTVVNMSDKAMLADALVRTSGHDGLFEWAMDQRRAVRPPNWDVVATRLSSLTEGRVRVSGEALRNWLLMMENERGDRDE